MKFLRLTDNQDGFIILIRPDTIMSIKCYTKDGTTSFINTETDTYKEAFIVRESEEEILRQLEKEDDD